MARPTKPLDADHIIKLYREGQGVNKLARHFGVRTARISSILNDAGIKTDRVYVLPVEKIVAAYEAGVSTNALAKKYGVSRNVIDKRLVAAGVTLRTQGEAEAVKWSRMTQKQRERQVMAAHKATRGKKRSLGAKLRSARTKAALAEFDSPQERELHDMLLERGIRTIPQMAVGPYNCDLGTSTVAVEIFGGNWHWAGRHLQRLPKRVDYFFNAALHVLIVQATDRYPLTPEMADYVAAYIKAASRNPAAPREYRVVRGAGETIAQASSDSDDRALVPSFTVTTNALGQYVSVSDYAVRVSGDDDVPHAVRSPGASGAVTTHALIHRRDPSAVLNTGLLERLSARLMGCADALGADYLPGFADRHGGFAPELSGGRAPAPAPHDAVNDEPFGLQGELAPMMRQPGASVRGFYGHVDGHVAASEHRARLQKREHAERGVHPGGVRVTHERQEHAAVAR